MDRKCGRFDTKGCNLRKGAVVMRRYKRRTGQEEMVGFVVWLILAVVLMPVAGLYLMSCEDAKARPWGSLLFVLGAALWLAVL